MLWAIVDGKRIRANPLAKGVDAQCPCCGTPVKPKCGSIVAWHWAHETKDCDLWSEPESLWHQEWKRCFPDRFQEVRIGPHRADIQFGGIVVELQNSSISPDVITEREKFYGNMAWIVNAKDFHIYLRDKGAYHSFRWKWPRKSWWSAKMPVFFDFGDDGILELKKLYSEVPCGGYGYLHKERTTVLQKIGVLPRRLRTTGDTSDSSRILAEIEFDPFAPQAKQAVYSL